MCTLSFLPDGRGGYRLATNRDESPRRGQGLPPSLTRIGARGVLSPRDPDAGGTWVAVDDLGTTLCLLNGEEGARVADAPSRGLLVQRLMRDPRPEEVRRQLRAQRPLERPFRLLVAVAGNPSLQGFAWDGAELGEFVMAGPCIAISSTWKRDEVEQIRRRAFASCAGDLRAFHAWHHAPGGDGFSVCMHRSDAGTVSCTLIEVRPDEVLMSYQPGPPCRGAPLVTSRMRRRPPPPARPTRPGR